MSTITRARIVEAFKRGYSVTEDGTVLGPRGELKLQLYGKQKYPTFSSNWGGRVFGIPAHLFAAYVFYGDEAFSGLVVRHLDGNTLNLSRENIKLGTYSQNEFDKDPEVRVRSAKLARAAQGPSSFAAKMDESGIQEVREFYMELGGKKAPNGATSKLAAKFGVSKTVLLNIKNGVNYNHV